MYMEFELLSHNDKKEKIQHLLKTGDYLDIIEKDIDGTQGKVIVSKKYANCRAIIIVEKRPQSPSERREE